MSNEGGGAPEPPGALLLVEEDGGVGDAVLGGVGIDGPEPPSSALLMPGSEPDRTAPAYEFWFRPAAALTIGELAKLEDRSDT